MCIYLGSTVPCFRQTLTQSRTIAAGVRPDNQNKRIYIKPNCIVQSNRTADTDDSMHYFQRNSPNGSDSKYWMVRIKPIITLAVYHEMPFNTFGAHIGNGSAAFLHLVVRHETKRTANDSAYTRRRSPLRSRKQNTHIFLNPDNLRVRFQMKPFKCASK